MSPPMETANWRLVVVTGAVLAALASAFCFATAATLQQQEAAREPPITVLDARLLWRLAHRPIWLLGIVADGLSATLHILALSLGSIALVQPLGVMGLVFAIPLVAVLRRHRISGRDVLAAFAVVAALAVILRLIPASTNPRLLGPAAIGSAVVLCVVLGGGALAIAHAVPGRTRALVLAGAAGTCFGVVAVLIRGLLLMTHQAISPGAIVVASVGIALLVPFGYWMLQNSYRVGHFAASLAVAVVIDPLAAIATGVPLLGEALPHAPGQAAAAAACAVVIAAGVVFLVRSPAHLFTVAGSTVAGSNVGGSNVAGSNVAGSNVAGPQR